MRSSFDGNVRYLFIILIIGIYLSGCCPPYCPVGTNGPIFLPLWLPPAFDESYSNGDYETLLLETNRALDGGTPYGVEARLYRGLALQALEKTDAAFEDFSYVAEHTDELSTIDQKYEMDLLYRNYMILSNIRGDIELSERLKDKAIDLRYTPAETILDEYENTFIKTIDPQKLPLKLPINVYLPPQGFDDSLSAARPDSLKR